MRNDTPVNRCKDVKNLELLFQRNLHFDIHIKPVCIRQFLSDVSTVLNHRVHPQQITLYLNILTLVIYCKHMVYYELYIFF